MFDVWENDFCWLPSIDFEPNPREPGRILFQVVYGGSNHSDWKEHDIEEITGEGGAFNYEHEYGELEYTLKASIEEKEIGLGWWIVENFRVHFTQDYYGEVDCDYDFAGPKRATWTDMEHFGMGKPSWLIKLYQWMTGHQVECLIE